MSSTSLLTRITTPDRLPESTIPTWPPWLVASISLVSLVLVLTLLVLPSMLANRLAPDAVVTRLVLASTVGLIPVLGLVVLARRRVPLATVFIHRPDRTITVWFVVGLTIALTVTGLALLLAGSSVSLLSTSPRLIVGHLVASLALGIWTGTVEELLFRGVLLSVIGQAWNWPGAVLVTATVFGLFHNGAAETALASGLYVLLTTIAGVFLALVVLTTGTVWSAVAIHAAWNTAFSPVLLAFSASPEPPALLVIPVTSHWLLTLGGADVPGSPLAVAVFFAVLGLFVVTRTWRIRGGR